jgi:hypothetical protein
VEINFCNNYSVRQSATTSHKIYGRLLGGISIGQNTIVHTSFPLSFLEEPDYQVLPGQ